MFLFQLIYLHRRIVIHNLIKCSAMSLNREVAEAALTHSKREKACSEDINSHQNT